MATQEVKSWINKIFFASLNNADFAQMESFCLLWNIFEKKVGNGSQESLGLVKIEKFIFDENITIDDSILQPCFDYFRSRYIENGETNSKFEKLNISNNKFKDIFKNILVNNNALEKEKILGISIIAYRIRNNSFHGTKGLSEISNQKDTFEYLNKFLMGFLDNFSLI